MVKVKRKARKGFRKENEELLLSLCPLRVYFAPFAFNLNCFAFKILKYI